MFTISSSGRPFGPDGCEVPVGQSTCGETRTLDIINEFRRLYEEKLAQIDNCGGGDCLQEKLRLQQDWIGDLTAQNEMLVKAVEELEHEATERVNLLEKKLQQSAQGICEVMKRYREYDVTNELLDKPLQKVFSLENDRKNMLEFIRRVREEKRWDVNGLTFYEVSYRDLFGACKKNGDTRQSSDSTSNPTGCMKGEARLKDRECNIQELQQKIKYYDSFGDVESICKELECKKEECISLQRSMKDTQHALVEEIASKHDVIVQLKKEVQQLEERCIQADKQTAFKDDIIKELRKEIKQLKQQKCSCTEEENVTLKKKVQTLDKENGCLKGTIKENRCQLESLARDFKDFLKSKDELKQKSKASEKKYRMALVENEKFRNEIASIKTINSQLEKEFDSVKEEFEKYKTDSEVYEAKIQKLSKENERIMNEMIHLNDENRNLLKTVENQRKRIDRTTNITQEEVTKLNATIDELQNDLQRTKHVQDKEEKINLDKIASLEETIRNLTNDLAEIEEKFEKECKVCKICRRRVKVGFAENAEVQASLAEDDQMEVIQKRDEIIKVQADTLNLLQFEIDKLKERENELKQDRDKKSYELQLLKNRVNDLENALEDSEGKAENLQKAVDCYLNSVNVLEASDDKHKIEIEQQKLTIANLQKALVAAKQDLDEVRQRSQENEEKQHEVLSSFNRLLSDMKNEKQNLVDECECTTMDYEYLQDMNFDLEVEHCNSLQDVDILENQLFKYQSLLKGSEDECKHYRTTCKKLNKQKKCYEEVVVYFKEEMCQMAEQLSNLQDLLTISNESTQEETCRLMQAYTNVQKENEKLSSKLAAIQQTAVLESQMNQLHESKICELQQLISERELDLSRHDQAIMNIRQSLKCSLKQNEELSMTICDLNETIAQLQEAVEGHEAEHSKGKAGTQMCWAQISDCKEKLEQLKTALNEKTTELCKVEMSYNDQNRALKSAQMEIKEMRERQKDKQRQLKSTVDELREKLLKSEENYCKACCEITTLQNQLGNVGRKEAVKDLEIKRYRKIVSELKNTLIDLNKTLATGKNLKLRHKCQPRERSVQEIDESGKSQETCFSCPCEVEFYQSIVETLKQSVIDLKKRLDETERKYQALEEESARKNEQLAELARKDKEYIELRKKLTDKLKQSQTQEMRYQELAGQFEKELKTIREELDVKTMQLDDVKRSSQHINSSKCVQLACAQEEVNNLKEELSRMLRDQRTLNAENEKLHAQSACMQATLSKLHEKSELLTGQLEQYLCQLQCVQNEKETLVQKNRELLSELRTLQNTFNDAGKQQRYTSDSIKILESEINDLRNNRDEICLESKTVINYVRAWLQEQKKIQEHTVRREQDYCDTIQRLKREYENLQDQYLVPHHQKPNRRVVAPCKKSVSPPPMCPSPWSLGSQGTTSAHDRSLSASPCAYEGTDWYSASFRNDSDEDDDYDEEEDWVSKVEHLAAQVRKTNSIWKSKMRNQDHQVSRDIRK